MRGFMPLRFLSQRLQPGERTLYNRRRTGGLMRARILGTILILVVTAAVTRQLSAQNPPPALKLFASAADVTAMIAKAKAERKPDQPNFIQPIVGLAPYTANLEHRVAGI